MKAGLDLIGMSSHAGEEPVQTRGKISGRSRRHAIQIRFCAAQRYPHITPATAPSCSKSRRRKDVLLAHAQFVRKIVHRHPAKAVSKKMPTRAREDSPTSVRR
jgi:hypothetical protein